MSLDEKLEGGVARELQVGKTYTANEDLVGSDGDRRFKAGRAAVGDEIVLIHAVTADSQASDENAVFVKPDAAREEYDSAFVIVESHRVVACVQGFAKSSRNKL